MLRGIELGGLPELGLPLGELLKPWFPGDYFMNVAGNFRGNPYDGRDIADEDKEARRRREAI